MSAFARRSLVDVLVLEIARLLAILCCADFSDRGKRDGLRLQQREGVRAGEEEVPTTPAVR